MNKAIIISVDCVLNATTGDPYQDIVEVLGKLKESGDTIIFLSHDTSKLDRAKQIFPQGNLRNRENIRSLIKKYPEVSFVIVGCHAQDVYVATNTKNLLLTAGWSGIDDEVAGKYGLVVPSAEKFFQTLNILKNHSAWFFELAVDSKSKVYALMNARTKFSAYGAKEVQLIQGFHSLLKKGDRRYFDVLLYHFLSGVSNNPEFREIQDWAIFPSSGCSLNPEMWEFKERIRYLMFGRKEQPIFIRHTPIRKSHYITDDTMRIPCDRHFASIIINPDYHGKLKNRAVCVFDDFLTNGTSFETARNLLLLLAVFVLALPKTFAKTCSHVLPHNGLKFGTSQDAKL